MLVAHLQLLRRGPWWEDQRDTFVVSATGCAAHKDGIDGWRVWFVHPFCYPFVAPFVASSKLMGAVGSSCNLHEIAIRQISLGDRREEKITWNVTCRWPGCQSRLWPWLPPSPPGCSVLMGSVDRTGARFLRDACAWTSIEKHISGRGIRGLIAFNSFVCACGSCSVKTRFFWNCFSPSYYKT